MGTSCGCIHGNVVAALDRGICDGRQRRKAEDDSHGSGEEGLKLEQRGRLFVGVAGWRKGISYYFTLPGG